MKRQVKAPVTTPMAAASGRAPSTPGERERERVTAYTLMDCIMVSLFLTKEGLTLAPTNLQRFITEELKCTCECNIVWCDTHKSYSHTEQ